jgi:hypothetical protein
MSNLNTIVAETITRQTVFPSAPGFGTPMFLCAHSFWPDRAKRFESLPDLQAAVVAAGGKVTDPICKGAAAVWANEPSPDALIIGKRLLASTQIVKLSPLNTTPGYVWLLFVTDQTTGLKEPVTYTNGNSETTQTIATAIGAAIMALASADVSTGVATSGVLLVTMVSGKLVEFSGLPPVSIMKFEDTSTDPGIATDAAAVLAAALLGGSPLSFYGVFVDHCSNLIGQALATWVESQKLFFVARTTDTKATDSSSTTDLMAYVQSGSFKRTTVMFAQYSDQDYRDGCLLGQLLPLRPGSYTAAFKNLPGIQVDALQDAEATNIEAKNGMWYRTIGGANITYEGKTGFGEFIDIPISIDYIGQKLQFACFGPLVVVPKVPYVQRGIAVLVGAMQSTLNDEVETADSPRMFASDPAPVVTGPKISTVSPSDKSTRRLKNIKYTGTLSGAIQGVNLQGFVTV